MQDARELVSKLSNCLDTMSVGVKQNTVHELDVLLNDTKPTTDISQVEFKVLKYSDKSRLKSGTILDILKDFFYLDAYISTKKESKSYITFKGFMWHVREKNKDKMYPGEPSIENLAYMFIDGCKTVWYQYVCISQSCEVSKDDIVKYLESLYINEAEYVREHGYDMFLKMERLYVG